MSGHSITIEDVDQLQFLGQFQHSILKQVPVSESHRRRLK
jgi:hypothetical protein